MQIIEQQIVGKIDEARCEDGIIVTTDFVAVIDGSTNKSRIRTGIPGKTGGRIAMEAVKDVIREACPQMDLPTFCEQATAKIQQLYTQYYSEKNISQLESHPENRFCCSAIVYSRHWNELWMIGDCQALLIRQGSKGVETQKITDHKPEEKKIAMMRSAYLKNALSDGVSINGEEPRIYTVKELRTHDIGRDAIIPQLLEVMKGENINYAVIDGFPIPMRKVKRFTNVLDEATEVVLATDGYPRIFPTLEETEAYLKKCLARDPLCIRRHKATKGWMKRTKSFDDRTYIRFR